MKTIVAVLIGAACGVAQLSAQAIHVKCKAEMKGQPVACITTPRDGSTITGPDVKVQLAADGKGEAHYHLFLDIDVPAAGAAIPEGPGITHLANGAKDFKFAAMPSGMHRLIVVLGDNGHVPVARQKSDTAYFTVATK
jgi:uncharacterized protein DUF4399